MPPPTHIASHHWPHCTYRVVHAEACEGIFRSPGWLRQRHRLWAVDVGPSFSSMVRVNGVVYRRNRYSVGVYSPGTVYEENMEVGRLNSWAWLLIEEKGTPSSLRELTGEAGFCILTDPVRDVHKQIVELAGAARDRLPGRSFRLNALLNQILATLFFLQAKPPEAEPVSGPKSHWEHPWRQAARALLEQSPPGGVTAKQLAGELGVSPSTLTHRYRNLCGESFQETIDHWRMEKACVLLGRNDLSVKQIAAMVGLSHQSYLSASFKAATGYSPSEYRKLERCGKAGS